MRVFFLLLVLLTGCSSIPQELSKYETISVENSFGYIAVYSSPLPLDKKIVLMKENGKTETEQQVNVELIANGKLVRVYEDVKSLPCFCAEDAWVFVDNNYNRVVLQCPEDVNFSAEIARIN